MKKFDIYKFLLVGLLSITLFSAAQAQEDVPRSDAPPREFDRRAPRPNLLRELALTGAQKDQIKRLNVDRKSLLTDAQRRVREAMRNLDQAIYADSLNETEIAARLKELQSAQSEIARLRSINELEVRKILTPAQLAKFREIRQQFAEMRENAVNRRGNQINRNNPNRRFNRGLRKIPND